METGTCDILLIGKTGIGKSTTAIKLLEWDKHERSINSLNYDGTAKNDRIKPVAGGGLKSVTTEIQAWENTVTKVRVVDVPGFAGTETHPFLDAWKQNLAIISRISRLISTNSSRTPDRNFKFCRILYFFPVRGVPVRVDACFKGELELLYSVFGDSVFELMVVVCTNRPDTRHQQLPLGIEDLNDVKGQFLCAFKGITRSDHTKLEVMYIELENNVNDTKTLLDKIKETYPHSKIGNTLKADPTACVKCQGNHSKVIETDKQASTSLWKKLRNAIVTPAKTTNTNTKIKCHPEFQHKEGSLQHYFIDRSQFSGYDKIIYEFYYESQCTKCTKPPGTEGCTEIGPSTVYSQHTTIIPSLPINLSGENIQPSDQCQLQGEVNGQPSDKRQLEGDKNGQSSAQNEGEKNGQPSDKHQIEGEENGQSSDKSQHKGEENGLASDKRQRESKVNGQSSSGEKNCQSSAHLEGEKNGQSSAHPESEENLQLSDNSQGVEKA